MSKVILDYIINLALNKTLEVTISLMLKCFCKMILKEINILKYILMLRIKKQA